MSLLHLPQHLRDDLKNKKFTDIIIKVEPEGVEFAGHRLVLSILCKYFDVLLNGKFKESAENIITLKEENAEYFKLFIDYIYGQIHPILFPPAEVAKRLVRYQYNTFNHDSYMEEFNLSSKNIGDYLDLLNCFYPNNVPEKIKAKMISVVMKMDQVDLVAHRIPGNLLFDLLSKGDNPVNFYDFVRTIIYLISKGYDSQFYSLLKWSAFPKFLLQQGYNIPVEYRSEGIFPNFKFESKCVDTLTILVTRRIICDEEIIINFCHQNRTFTGMAPSSLSSKLAPGNIVKVETEKWSPTDRNHDDVIYFDMCPHKIKAIEVDIQVEDKDIRALCNLFSRSAESSWRKPKESRPCSYRCKPCRSDSDSD